MWMEQSQPTRYCSYREVLEGDSQAETDGDVVLFGSCAIGLLLRVANTRPVQRGGKAEVLCNVDRERDDGLLVGV